ncbi:MAG: dihydroneopterin aldolase [Verrucomicrobiota bacterium]
MPSTITIQRQQVHCHIGVPEDERAQPQILEVSVTFPIPECDQLAAKDEVQRTVDYHDISLLINAVSMERPRKLVETLAADITERILREFHLAWIDIEIRKFILPDTEAVIVKYRKTGKV